MDTTDLAGLEHLNLIEAFAAIGSGVDGAVVRRQDGVALIATGLPFLLFNQILIEDPDASSISVAAAVATMRDRGHGFVLDLRVGTDDRFIPDADALGLVPLSPEPWLPGMAMHPVRPDATPPFADGHEIRQVADVAGLEDHVMTAAVGFGMPEAVIRAAMNPAILRHPGAAVYVGYTDGQPVTTGLGLRTGRTIGVFNISTIDTARQRGYGAAMTMRIVADAAAEGCDVAALQASEMGLPIYERLGFETVVRYMGYVELAAATDPS